MRNSLLLLCILISVPPAEARVARGDFTLLVIPSRHGAVQVGRDLQDRHPLMLMTYDPASPEDNPFLHIWQGTQWVHVSSGDFFNGSFLRNDPSRVVVVGPATPQVGRLVENAIAWSPEVLNLESEDPVELINAFGRMMEFRAREWRWFASRYGLELEDMSEGMPRLSWYDSYVASELPPATNPFRRRRDTEPEEGLRPIIRLEPVPEDDGSEP